MQVFRVQQRHGVACPHKVLESHGIGWARRLRTSSLHTVDRGQELALLFQQWLLSLPDLLLHARCQALSLAFEPQVEPFGLAAEQVCFAARVARSRRSLAVNLCLVWLRCSLVNPVFQELAMHVQIADRTSG